MDFFRAIFFGVVRVSFRFSAQVLVFKEGRGPKNTRLGLDEVMFSTCAFPDIEDKRMTFFEHQHLSRKAKRNAHNTKENGAKKGLRYTTKVVGKDHARKIPADSALYLEKKLKKHQTEKT